MLMRNSRYEYVLVLCDIANIIIIHVRTFFFFGLLFFIRRANKKGWMLEAEPLSIGRSISV